MIIGLIAGALTTFSALPQLLKVIKTKDTQSFSLSFLIIFCTGIFLWIVYGVMLRRLALILWNSITFFFWILVLFHKIKELRKEVN